VNFFTHENFPRAAGELLKAFDGGSHNFEFFSVAYPPGTPDAEWIECLGKQVDKPAILRLGGISGRNKVERSVIREAGCIFVCFADGWSKRMTWHEFVWKLLKHWPEIVLAVGEIQGVAILEVSVNGKIRRTNL
jgi:hypothetical protein